MKIDQSLFSDWIASKEYSFPGFKKLLSESEAKVLIIGASVFEIYQMQGWIPAFTRQTADIDLSIGIVGDDSLYVKAKKLLLDLNYQLDKKHPYRFHPPVKVYGGLTYIDLLAYPATQETRAEIATNAMGVGPGFSFSGFEFAGSSAIRLEKNTFFPNPFGMIALKIASYLDEPIKRKKDFVDILELISGLVETGQHFELDSYWKPYAQNTEAMYMKAELERIANEDISWDIEDVRSDLNSRGFTDHFIDDTLLKRVKVFLNQM